MAADAVSTVAALEQRWRAALLAKDDAVLRSMIHPEFKLVGVRPAGGFSADLEEWMAALHRMDIVSVDIDVLDAVEVGQTLVGTIDARWQVRYMRQSIDERVLLTDVWVCSNGEWQVIGRHTSPVPAGTALA